MGHEAFLVRYIRSCPRIRIRRKFSESLQAAFRSFIRKFKGCRVRCFNQKHDRGFDAFRKRYIIASDRIYLNYTDFLETPLDADVYVCGSDQIWGNITKSAADFPFWGDIAKDRIRRIAYAASYGCSELEPSRLEFIRPLISKYDLISVREASGVGICMKAGRADAVWVPDPTMLYHAADYQRQFNFQPTTLDRKRYLLGYFINIAGSSEVRYRELIKISSSQSLQLIIIPASGSHLYFRKKHLVTPDPCEWLRLISNATFYCTTSYHGVVFGLLFHKNFVVFLLNSPMDNRVVELLALVGLSSRIYNGGNITTYFNQEIDWGEVDQKIDAFRKVGKSFLANCGL